MGDFSQKRNFSPGVLRSRGHFKTSPWRRALVEPGLRCLQWCCDERGARLMFQMGGQAGSIYFDRRRRKVFYRGHHVKKTDLDPQQWMALKMLYHCLDESILSSTLARDYRRCLEEDFLGGGFS